ncbi:transmembrane and TPR repeat-containing protein 3 [Trichonephila clavipes]|nr:transmembrane and TPR repeat-containing protein 3 [Trichonephila clavipes]
MELYSRVTSTKTGDQNDKWILWFTLSMACSGMALLAKEQGITVLAVCIAWRILQLLGSTRFVKF